MKCNNLTDGGSAEGGNVPRSQHGKPKLLGGGISGKSQIAVTELSCRLQTLNHIKGADPEPAKKRRKDCSRLRAHQMRSNKAGK
jgi:hypothetical protein